MPSCPIELGQLFSSWGDFKEAIQDWSIADKFQFKSLHKDRSRADYRCRTRTKKDDCPWRVYATITRKQEIKVKILEPHHSCVRDVRAKRETCNSQAWLRRHVPKHLTVTTQTRPEEIQDTIRTHYGEIVNYQAAHEIKTSLVGDQQVVDQPQLPAYLYPYVDTCLERNTEIGLWLKSTSAAFLGRDSRQEVTTTSQIRRCFQLKSRISSSPTIELQDGKFMLLMAFILYKPAILTLWDTVVQRKAKLHLPNPAGETRPHNRLPLCPAIRLAPIRQSADP